VEEVDKELMYVQLLFQEYQVVVNTLAVVAVEEMIQEVEVEYLEHPHLVLVEHHNMVEVMVD